MRSIEEQCKVVDNFASVMKQRLRSKHSLNPKIYDDWLDARPGYLLKKLIESVGEIANALDDTSYSPGFDSFTILKEAADAANFAMMLAETKGDNFKGDAKFFGG